MEIISAEYVISSPSYDKCPEPDKPEYAFIGRSNVGKSSLINMICNKKDLAKISRSPGKTQLINHFAIISDDGTQWWIVDLPGYGFAKVSKVQRENWKKMIEEYLRYRKNLIGVFLLIDSRHSPQKSDIEFINKIGEWAIPFALVFTKSDKISQKEVFRNIKDFMNVLGERWEELPSYFITSVIRKSGRKQILAYIDQLNQQVKNNNSK